MKTRLFLIAGVAALMTASCTEAELQGPVADGEGIVSLTLTQPSIATKAYAGGEKALDLNYAVYPAGETTMLLSGEKVNAFSGLTAELELQLATGKSYDVILWADAPTAPYEFDALSQSVTVDYTNVAANNDYMDAFYAKATVVVNGPVQQDVKLTRPFAQINLGTNDLAQAQLTGQYTVTSVSMAAEVYSTFNLATGLVGGEAPVTFTAAPLPAEEFPVVADPEYAYLNMNYILVGNDKTTVDLEFVIKDKNAQAVKTLNVANVPVQRNYRTNIFGSLLTEQADLNIEIVPGIKEDEKNNILISSVVRNAEELALAVERGGEIALGNDIVLDERLEVAGNTTIDLNGRTIYGEALATRAAGEAENCTPFYVAGGTLTINGDGFVKGGKGGNFSAVYVKEGKVVINGGTYSVGTDANGEGNSTICVRKGEVIINGGHFSTEGASNNVYFVLNKLDSYKSESTITVTGGTFVNFDPSAGKSENPDENFVAEGYKSIKTSATTWEVMPESESYVVKTSESLKFFATENGGEIELAEGEYTLDFNISKDVTITGTADTKLSYETSVALNGANAEFKNVTIAAPEGNPGYTGLQHAGNVTFDGCTFENTYWCYSDGDTKTVFNNCTFKQTAPDAYNVWTYGSNVDFNNCVFYCAGKAALVYAENSTVWKTVNFNNCKFYASAPANDGKAAIEIDSSLRPYEVNVTGCTAEGFDRGRVSNDMLFNVKRGVEGVKGDAGVNCQLTVDIADGVKYAAGKYQLSNASGMYWFANEVNVNGNTFKNANKTQTVELANDIDLAGSAWKPVGPNADGANKFQGVFEGNLKAIRNLVVKQEAAYHAAGLFGALNGTVQNLVIDGADVASVSSGASTSNGTAVVAGSIYNSGTIKGVTVKNAKVNGNRYVGGIAGYVYGIIENCAVENSEITAACDDLTGDWDNGDKVGGIAGFFPEDADNHISGCSVKGVAVKGYRDLGGIVGYATDTVSECKVLENVTITVDNTHNYKEYAELAKHDANSIVGEGTATDCTGEAVIISSYAN